MKRNHLLLIVGIPLAAIVLWWTAARPSINDWPITNESPAGTAIIAFGDSLTAGHRVDPASNYPSRLSRAIGRPILNRGNSGDTTADGLRRLERDVLAHNPRIVLLCLGGNDMLRRQPADRQFENLREIIGRIHAAGALVILLGLEGDGFLYSSDYGDRYEQLARETGCVLVPDLLDGVIGRSSLMIDNIHPNEQGYERVVERIMKYAGEYLVR